jgi:hypothetical protein
MVKEETRGRKALSPEQKKTKLQIYIERYKIDKLGGIDESQFKLTNLFNQLYDKKTIRNPKLEKR